MKDKAIIVSGYFNPLHKGHIEYFHNAKKIASKLFVIINNDYQIQLKGTKIFMLEDERVTIIKELKVVDHVYLSVDKSRDVISTIKIISKELSDKYILHFGNGGDQNNSTIPEAEICKQLNIKLIDGLGEKIQSSSWLINKR